MTARNAYRDLPSVDRVLAHERVRALSAEYSGDAVVALVREALASAREAVARGDAAPAPAARAALGRGAGRDDRGLARLLQPGVRPGGRRARISLHASRGAAPAADRRAGGPGGRAGCGHPRPGEQLQGHGISEVGAARGAGAARA